MSSLKDVVFTFSKTRAPNSYELNYTMDTELHARYEEGNMLEESDWDCELDGHCVYLNWSVEKYVAKLWNEGYNYVRCEYKQ